MADHTIRDGVILSGTLAGSSAWAVQQSRSQKNARPSGPKDTGIARMDGNGNYKEGDIVEFISRNRHRSGGWIVTGRVKNGALELRNLKPRDDGSERIRFAKTDQIEFVDLSGSGVGVSPKPVEPLAAEPKRRGTTTAMFKQGIEAEDLHPHPGGSNTVVAKPDHVALAAPSSAGISAAPATNESSFKTVYHGAKESFGEFNANLSRPTALYGKGIYLTDDKEKANSYAVSNPDAPAAQVRIAHVDNRTLFAIDNWITPEAKSKIESAMTPSEKAAFDASSADRWSRAVTGRDAYETLARAGVLPSNERFGLKGADWANEVLGRVGYTGVDASHEIVIFNPKDVMPGFAPSSQAGVPPVGRNDIGLQVPTGERNARPMVRNPETGDVWSQPRDAARPLPLPAEKISVGDKFVRVNSGETFSVTGFSKRFGDKQIVKLASADGTRRLGVEYDVLQNHLSKPDGVWRLPGTATGGGTTVVAEPEHVQLAPAGAAQTTRPATPKGIVEGESWFRYEGGKWIPSKPGEGMLNVTDQPHVFTAKVSMLGNDSKAVGSLEDAKVIVAHGYRRNGVWVFKDGRSISDVIHQYNLANPNNPIKVAAVCNAKGVAAEIDGVVHATGTEVVVSGHPHKGGTEVRIWIKDPKGSFVFPESPTAPAANAAAATPASPASVLDPKAQVKQLNKEAKALLDERQHMINKGGGYDNPVNRPRLAEIETQLGRKAQQLKNLGESQFKIRGSEKYTPLGSGEASATGASVGEQRLTSAANALSSKFKSVFSRRPSSATVPAMTNVASGSTDKLTVRQRIKNANAALDKHFEGAVDKVSTRVNQRITDKYGDTRTYGLAKKAGYFGGVEPGSPVKPKTTPDPAEKLPLRQRIKNANAALDKHFEGAVDSVSGRVNQHISDNYGHTKAYNLAKKAGYFEGYEPGRAGDTQLGLKAKILKVASSSGAGSSASANSEGAHAKAQAKVENLKQRWASLEDEGAQYKREIAAGNSVDESHLKDYEAARAKVAGELKSAGIKFDANGAPNFKDMSGVKAKTDAKLGKLSSEWDAINNRADHLRAEIGGGSPDEEQVHAMNNLEKDRLNLLKRTKAAGIKVGSDGIPEFGKGAGGRLGSVLDEAAGVGKRAGSALGAVKTAGKFAEGAGKVAGAVGTGLFVGVTGYEVGKDLAHHNIEGAATKTGEATALAVLTKVAGGGPASIATFLVAGGVSGDSAQGKTTKLPNMEIVQTWDSNDHKVTRILTSKSEISQSDLAGYKKEARNGGVTWYKSQDGKTEIVVSDKPADYHFVGTVGGNSQLLYQGKDGYKLYDAHTGKTTELSPAAGHEMKQEFVPGAGSASSVGHNPPAPVVNKPEIKGLKKDQTMPSQMTTSELTGWGWKKGHVSKDGSTTYVKHGNTLTVDKKGNGTYTNNAHGHAIKQQVTVADHKTSAPLNTWHMPGSGGAPSVGHSTPTPVVHKPEVKGLTKNQTLPSEVSTKQLQQWGWHENSSGVWHKGGNTVHIAHDGSAVYTNNSGGKAVTQHIKVPTHTERHTMTVKKPVVPASVNPETTAKATHGIYKTNPSYRTVTEKVPYTVTYYTKETEPRAQTPTTEHDDLMAKVRHGEALAPAPTHLVKHTKTEYKNVQKTVQVSPGGTYAAPSSTYIPAPAPPPPPPPHGSSARPGGWQHHTANDLEDRKTRQTVVIDGKTHTGVTVNTFKDGESTFQENGKTIGYSGHGSEANAGKVTTKKPKHSGALAGRTEEPKATINSNPATGNSNTKLDQTPSGTERVETKATYTSASGNKYSVGYNHDNVVSSKALKNGGVLQTMKDGSQVEVTPEGGIYRTKAATHPASTVTSGATISGSDNYYQTHGTADHPGPVASTHSQATHNPQGENYYQTHGTADHPGPAASSSPNDGFKKMSPVTPVSAHEIKLMHDAGLDPDNVVGKKTLESGDIVYAMKNGNQVQVNPRTSDTAVVKKDPQLATKLSGASPSGHGGSSASSGSASTTTSSSTSSTPEKPSLNNDLRKTPGGAGVDSHGSILSAKQGKNGMIYQMSDGRYVTSDGKDAGWWGDGKGGGVSKAGIGKAQKPDRGFDASTVTGGSASSASSEAAKLAAAEQLLKSNEGKSYAKVYAVGATNPVPASTTAGHGMSDPSGLGAFGADSNSGACFPAGSLILTPHGHKPIEQIELGDKVMTWNIDKGTMEETIVTDTLAHNARETLVIKTGHSKIITTHEHPFWDGEDWVKAEELKSGHSNIMDQKGDLHLIESVHKGPNQSVYNFHVLSPAHNYFVDGFLVHNRKITD